MIMFAVNMIAMSRLILYVFNVFYASHVKHKVDNGNVLFYFSTQESAREW